MDILYATAKINYEQNPLMVRAKRCKSLYYPCNKIFEREIKKITQEEDKEIEQLMTQTWQELRLRYRGIEKNNRIQCKRKSKYSDIRYEIHEATKNPLFYALHFRKLVEDEIEYWEKHEIKDYLKPVVICFMGYSESGKETHAYCRGVFKIVNQTLNLLTLEDKDGNTLYVSNLKFLKLCEPRDLILFVPSNVNLLNDVDDSIIV